MVNACVSVRAIAHAPLFVFYLYNHRTDRPLGLSGHAPFIPDTKGAEEFKKPAVISLLQLFKCIPPSHLFCCDIINNVHSSISHTGGS